MTAHNFRFALALAAGTTGLLVGCATHLPNGQNSSVSGRLIYSTVLQTETCGANLAWGYADRGVGFALAPSPAVSMPYRVVKLSGESIGESYAMSYSMRSILAYVPDGTPALAKGDVVLVRMGDGPHMLGFDYGNPAPATGLSNVVIADLGRAPSSKPTVGYHQSPWLRMPWAQSVAEYGLRFTPYWHFDKASGQCEPTRALEPTDPRRMELPTWPARKGS